MKTIGIIGFGSFGKYLAEKLSSHAKVLVYSQSGKASSWAASLEAVAQADYVVLAVPLEAYEATLIALEPHLRPDSVLVDVCSVKVEPAACIRRILPDQPLVVMHPMFGPESAAASLAGHTCIMCPEVSTRQPYEVVRRFVDSLGLTVVEMSADAHDREIAVVQGLTFFIARALNKMGVHDQSLHTPSFARLLSLADLDLHHSADLFRTIQKGNSHTPHIRKKLIAVLEDIEKDLSL